MKTNNKIIINSVLGSVIWESEKETIKEAVVEKNNRDADLRGANLRGADLRGANLIGVNLIGAKHDNWDELRPAYWIIPEVGAFIAWKSLHDGVLAKIEIPAKAKRTSSLQGRKCRAEYVKTVALYKDGKPFKGPGISKHDGAYKYVVGKITRPDKYDDSIFVECSNGIHFFVTRIEAERW